MNTIQCTENLVFPTLPFQENKVAFIANLLFHPSPAPVGKPCSPSLPLLSTPGTAQSDPTGFPHRSFLVSSVPSWPSPSSFPLVFCLSCDPIFSLLVHFKEKCDREGILVFQRWIHPHRSLLFPFAVFHLYPDHRSLEDAATPTGMTVFFCVSLMQTRAGQWLTGGLPPKPKSLNLTYTSVRSKSPYFR